MTPSSKPFRLPAFAWLVIPLCALLYLIWIDVLRVRHVERVSSIAEEPADAASPAAERDLLQTTGGWRPRLIVPEHNNASFEWLASTRQMLAEKEWRIRHIDYENAPFGHAVLTPSPYRWWLGVLAWCDHRFSGRGLGEALERGALIADPLLHGMLLVGLVVFVRWRFGKTAAAVAAVGTVGFYPFAAAFLPGMPEDGGLAQIWAILSVIILLAGVYAARADADGAGQPARGWFFVGGLAGGIALWVNVAKVVPVLTGIALGGLIAAWTTRIAVRTNPKTPGAPLPWRTWALGGGLATVAAYLIEYAPSHLGSWQLKVVHPLFGLAWIGAGELLTRISAWAAGGKAVRGVGDVLRGIFGVIALASVPVAMRLTHTWSFLEADLGSGRLSRLAGSPSASSLLSWIVHDGLAPAVWVALLPLLTVVPAVWLLARRSERAETRWALALALGPVLVVAGLAFRYLNNWQGLEAMLIVLAIGTSVAVSRASQPAIARWMWAGVVAVACVPGLIALYPRSETETGDTFTPQEVYGLIERDLGRSLVTQRGNRSAIILAPHNQTTALHYYAGLRGIPTFGWENRDGLSVAVRIASASTPEEARELIERREIAQIIIPSWDSYLDIYAQMGMGTLEGTFLSTLHEWKLPGWLRPVPYQLPTIAGFEGQSVTILEVVEEQDDAVALSRLAQYFVEMGQLDRAAAVGQTLRRFPADLGAVVARAEVDFGRGDMEAFGRTVELLRPRLASGADRSLPWDRRLALGVVLFQAKFKDLAQERIRRCLDEADEAKVRSLSTASIYSLLVLSRTYGLSFANEQVHQLALSLLPRDAQARL